MRNPLRLVGLLLLAAAGPMVRPASAGEMKSYPTRYYIIHSDLPADEVREAAVRMTAMAEEYYERTKGFSGTIRKRLPFYLYSSADDYKAAGGIAGSMGCFTGDKLMAQTGGRLDETTWRIVQHEGFHQFVFAVMGGRIPTWANEGLAEYFSMAVFTGDGFVSGVLPPSRLKQVQAGIKGDKFKSLEAMMTLTSKQWIGEININNYNQAWSMVQFLGHGEDGRYQSAFVGFLRGVSARKDWQTVWRGQFGSDVEAFEKKWKDWWLAQPPDASADLYRQAVVATATSYFARATGQGQKFESADAFFAAAKAGQLKADKNDWLPPSLLAEMVKNAPKTGKWTVTKMPGRGAVLRCELPHVQFNGYFVLAPGGRVDKVRVARDEPPKAEQSADAKPAARPAS